MDRDKVILIDNLLRDIIKKYAVSDNKAKLYKDLKNLTITEIKTICAVGSGAPKTMKEVASELNVSVSTPTTTVDKLIEKGCIQRYTGVEDRRQVLVKLTENGIYIYDEIQNLRVKTTEMLLQVLTDSETEFFQKILMKIDKQLDKQ